MPRLGVPRKIEMNVVISGHKRTEPQARKALAAAGITVIPTHLPNGDPNPKHRVDDWGLPSYTDPITAEKAGQPNAGHTPGSQHPAQLEYLILEGDHADRPECAEGCDWHDPTEPRDHACKHVGEDYEQDQRVGFVAGTVECPELDAAAVTLAVTKAHDAVEKIGWQLRAHWETQPAGFKAPDPVELIAAMEDRLAALEEALGHQKVS